MAYTKQTWACGDEITAEKLNHIEDGIENAGGGTLILKVTRTDGECTYYDHTWQEVYDALANGQRCVAWDGLMDDTNIIVTEILAASYQQEFDIPYAVVGVKIDPDSFEVKEKVFVAESADSQLKYCPIS